MKNVSKVVYDKEKMMEAFFGLLKIPSVKSQPTENAPFGEEVKNALTYTLDLAKSLGFETKNYDNYIGEVIWGEGEPFGILCHLDVVPCGDLAEWKTPPFTPTIVDDKLYCRGALDDKCGSISVLFAMKALLDAGFKPKRKIQLILGCDEESGWGCIEHYKKVATLPEEGFSPDADFPVIYAEKGIVHITYKFKKSPDLIYVKGGERTNVVCDFAEAKVKNVGLYADYQLKLANDTLQSFGVSAHGASPEKGVNALDNMFRFLSDYGYIDSEAYLGLFKDIYGLKQICDQTGYLTFSPNVCTSDDNFVYVTVDCRYPATKNYDDIICELAKVGDYQIKNYQAPLYQDKDSGLVKVLCDIYNEITGEKAEPIAIGGGTYARALKRGVAFGPSNGEEGDSIHKPNEYITLSTIDNMNKIYLETLIKTCF